ncbi:MAG: serine protease [Acidimicrobiales bacterium]
MRITTRAAALAAGIALMLFIVAPTSRAAGWAPAATAAIHPGVMTITSDGQCTANFVFTNGGDVYIGQAAHCASTGGQTDTDGCSTGSQPLGTPVEVGGASEQGTLVYSSWLTMQAAGESDPDTCAYNDLALVRLSPNDAANVNPSIPHWGGPVGVNTTGVPQFWSLYSYGNSSLRQGITLLSPKVGVGLDDTGSGWSHEVSTLSPGIPGDSGSPFLDSSGKALGILSTLQVGVPFVVSNGVGDIGREIDYARSHVPALSGLALANGTEPFNSNQLPLDLAHPLG